MKQNVEIFSSKSESDIETMTVDEIKVVLEKAVGRKLNVDVTSEKAKKVRFTSHLLFMYTGNVYNLSFKILNICSYIMF